MIEPKIPNISLVPSEVLNFQGITINSAVLSSLVITGIFLLIATIIRLNLKIIPSKGQLIFEEVVSFFYNQCLTSFGDEKKAKRYVSLIITLFLFIFIANQFTIIPLVGSLVLDNHEVFKSPTGHLSQTLTLSIVILGLSHLIALFTAPWKHIANLLNLNALFEMKSIADLPNVFLQLFLGILNIIGELAKVISLSARLFGNIFAGEVMVGVIAGLSFYTMFFVPIPFIFLSIFSGIVQAFVFSFLSLSFMSDIIKSVE